MKTCTVCGQTKPDTEFYSRRKGLPATQSHCKACQNEKYRQRRLQNLKESRRRERQRRLAKSSSLQFPQCRRQRIRLLTYKDQAAAKCMVRDAVQRGLKWANNHLRPLQKQGLLLFRPPFCPWCGRSSPYPIEAHHYLGYAPQHRITGTIWVCRTCHKEIGVLMREAELDGLPAIDGFKGFIRSHTVQHQKRLPIPTQRIVAEGYNENTQSQKGAAGQGDTQHAA